MKSLFKVTLLAASMVMTFGATQAVAAETETAVNPAEAAKSAVSKFSNEDKRVSYALGASLGRYMDNSIKEQAKLDINLDRATLLAGVQEAYSGKSKLTDKEIEVTLQTFGEKIKQKAQVRMEKEAKDNATKGALFSEKFAKEEGVKKTASGLLIKSEKEGAGAELKDTDMVVVNYKGTLIDGTEFDNSYKRGEPLTFRLDGVIPGWTEALKLMKKGGKAKLVIPPKLAYGESGAPGSIPPNSTLVFDVELLDVNPVEQPNAEAPAAEKK